MNNEEIQVVQPEQNEQELVLEEETTPESDSQEIDYKAEFLKQKAINQRLSKKIAQPVEKKQELQTNKEDGDLRKTVEQLALAEKKRQFGYRHDLSPDEVDAVFKINPEPSDETLKDPFVEGGLAKLRSKRKVEENTPSSSSRSASFKLPSKENLTDEDRQKAFEDFKKQKFGH
jgi:hypothetical protein